SARYSGLLHRLLAFAFSRIGTFLGRLLVARLSGSLGLFTLVPRVTASGTSLARRQARVLGQHRLSLAGTRDFLTVRRRRVFPARALIAVGSRLVQRDQLVLARPNQVGT